MSSPLFRFIVGLDQAFNPLVYGGSEDVTISSQSAYNELMLGKNRRARQIIDWVFRNFFHQHMHCYYSLLDEADEFHGETAVILAKLLELGVK